MMCPIFLSARIIDATRVCKLEMLKKLDLRVQMAGTIESLCLSEEIIKSAKN